MIARLLIPKVRNIKDLVSGYFMMKRGVVMPYLSSLNPRGYLITRA